MLRASVALLDPAGKPIATYSTKKDGRYEFPFAAACESCRLSVQRDGFSPAEQAVHYNGANSLWFSFALKRTPALPMTDD